MTIKAAGLEKLVTHLRTEYADMMTGDGFVKLRESVSRCQIRPTGFTGKRPKRKKGEAASADDAHTVEALQESVERMGANLSDWDTFLDENRQFHDLIAWGSGNPIFGYLINSLHWITDGTVLGIDYPLRFRKAVLEAHQSIADAVAAADPDASEAAMKAHMDDTLVYFEKRYSNVLTHKLSWEHFGGA